MLTNSVDKVYIWTCSVKKGAATTDIGVDGAIGSAFLASVWKSYRQRVNILSIKGDTGSAVWPRCLLPIPAPASKNQVLKGVMHRHVAYRFNRLHESGVLGSPS